MKKTLYALFVRVLLAAVLAGAASFPAQATAFINDVMLVGGSKTDVLRQIMTLRKNGWTIIDTDLNEGAGGDYILLLYKTDSHNDGFNYGSITGFYISNQYSESLAYNGRTYFPVPCAGGSDFVEGHGDLNEGCGQKSDYIYLYYTRDLFPNRKAVTGISFNDTKSGSVGLNGSSTGYDLNSNAGGKYIYMHVATDTARSPLQIGNGTAGTNTIPFYLGNEYYPYSLSQQIYTAEDIGMAGTITALSFFHRMKDVSLSMKGVRIYMKHTDKDCFAGEELDPMDDFIQVYNGDLSVSGSQWMTIILDKPFEYDGNSNLMICCYDPTGSHPQGNTFTYHAADNMMRRMAAHSRINLNQTLTGTANTTMRNDIQLNIVPDPYPNPVNLAVTGFTDEAASISWSAPTGTHPAVQRYEWQFKKAEDTSWSDAASTTGTTASLTGLSAFKEYMFRVRALYSGGKSNYSVFRFTTAVGLPYTCGFESGMPGWSQVDYKHYYNIDYTGISEEARHDGAYGYLFDGYDQDPVPQYLISPGLPNNAALAVSFFYRNFASPSFETFQVGYSTTTRDISAFTWGEEITDKSTEWRQYTNQFPAGTQYVAVKYVSNLYRLYLDDFEFVAYSPYEKPSRLSVTEVTDQNATLNWTAPESATGYAWQYRQVNSADWSKETTTTRTSVTLDNLAANTEYDFRIKALFGGYASNYVTLRFLTEGPMESIPHYQDFEHGIGGWRLVQGYGRSGITTREQHDGSYGFEFDEGSPQAQFLRSPLLEEGSSSKIVSFYFKNHAEPSGESTTTGYQSSFQVGWSTNTNPLKDFVFTPVVEAVNGRWNRFSLQLPEGARHIAIKVPDHTAWLYVDDISITEAPKLMVTSATVMGETKYVATFFDSAKKWRLPEGALAYTVEKEGADYVFYCINDIIPAGTPVVIMMDKTPEETGTTKELPLSLTSDPNTTPHPDNILQGTDSPLSVINGKINGKTVYVLGIRDGKLNFYKFSGNEIPARKVYFLVD